MNFFCTKKISPKIFSPLLLKNIRFTLVSFWSFLNDIASSVIKSFKTLKKLKFIEYPKYGINELKKITKIISKNTGGLLLIDYGYTDKKMKNTLQAVSNHKFANILSNIGNVDITHNINFNIFEKFVKQMNGLKTNLTSQKNFLTKLGIKERAEIISKNKNFTKKSDIYYRLERLINKKQMGHLFKVMLIKNDNNKFKLGF